jgi:uncharacterized RDD family membrane protein YckC
MSAVIISDETLVIETPERVPLHFALASIGNRFIACAIDHTIQIVTLIVIFTVFAVISDNAEFSTRLSNAPKWVIALMVVLVFLLMSGYFAIFEWLWHGQTPGKRWLKLRVIREDGRPISFFEAFVRNLVRDFDIMPFPFFQPTGTSASEIWSPGRWSCASAKQKRRPSRRCLLRRFPIPPCAVRSSRCNSPPT